MEPEPFLALCDAIPSFGSVDKALEAHGLDWRRLGEMRRRHPEIDKAYREACTTLGDRLAHKQLDDMDPETLRAYPPQMGSAVANVLANRAKAAQWLAARLNRAEYAETVTHTHDVTVRAVVALPALGTTATLGAGTSTAPALPAGSGVDDAQVVEAEVLSDSNNDSSATV